MKNLRTDALAGVITVLTVHQPLILAVHGAGLAPWRAYDLSPVAPFGLPALASASFWARFGRSVSRGSCDPQAAFHDICASPWPEAC